MFDYNFKKSIEKNFNELEKFNYLKNFNEQTRGTVTGRCSTATALATGTRPKQ